MPFTHSSSSEPVRLKLKRDRTRALKQGYPWIYADWLSETPSAPPGSRALVRDRDGTLIAYGMYDPKSPIAVRVCAVERERLDDALVLERLNGALSLRRALFDEATTGFRLLNGEGDGLPGLVCDLYGAHAVVKLDGPAPLGFWDVAGVTEWLLEETGVRTVYQKFRSDESSRGKLLHGSLDAPAVDFVENGLRFRADLVAGQKTGFFFDQRDNRQRIRQLARDRRVLNLFAYTGGFSVYAGVGGAKEVTTVDIAKPAVTAAEENWSLNGLSANRHRAVAADAFEFLAQSATEGKRWDLVVVDPPSFAPAERHVERATESYQNLFAASLAVLDPGGLIALSSCSSHISPAAFLEICQTAMSKSRRRGNVLGVYGQPEDHPFPLACTELQYLKFVLLRVR